MKSFVGNVFVFCAFALGAAMLALLILPALASSGDYGVNTGGSTQNCPAGQVWQPSPATSGGSCVWDGVSTYTPTPVPPTATPVPPTNTPRPTNTPYPTYTPQPSPTPCPAGQVPQTGTSGSGCQAA